MKEFTHKYFLFFVISPLLVGFGTYLVARPPESYILGKMFDFKQSRFIEMIQIPIKYDWMKYNLPDALWMFSFCSLNISIWGVIIFSVNSRVIMTMKNLLLSSVCVSLCLVYSCGDIPNAPDNPRPGKEYTILELLKLVPNKDYSKLNDVRVSAGTIRGNLAQTGLFRKLVTGRSNYRILMGSGEISLNKLYEAIPYFDSRATLIKESFGTYVTIKSQKSKDTPFQRADSNEGTESPTNFTKEFSYRFYNPELIKIANVDELKKINRERDLILKWPQDPKNDKPVEISIIFRKHKNGLVPTESDNIRKIVEDTGMFIIPSSELSIFPKGSWVNIRLFRGNHEVIQEDAITMYSSDSMSSQIL